MEDFHHATASGFDAMIGEDIAPQATHNVSDAETHIYITIDQVAIQHSQGHDHWNIQTEFNISIITRTKAHI